MGIDRFGGNSRHKLITSDYKKAAKSVLVFHCTNITQIRSIPYTLSFLLQQLNIFGVGVHIHHIRSSYNVPTISNRQNFPQENLLV